MLRRIAFDEAISPLTGLNQNIGMEIVSATTHRRSALRIMITSWEIIAARVTPRLARASVVVRM